MKKTILFFAVTTAILLSECGISDYECNTYFKIHNQTGNDIVVEVGRKEVIYASTSIGIGKEQTIYDFGTLCGKDHISVDHYSEDDNIENLFMKINGETIPDVIWKRKYWNFASEPYEITFTLTLTAELLEDIHQQEEL